MQKHLGESFIQGMGRYFSREGRVPHYFAKIHVQSTVGSEFNRLILTGTSIIIIIIIIIRIIKFFNVA